MKNYIILIILSIIFIILLTVLILSIYSIKKDTKVLIEGHYNVTCYKVLYNDENAGEYSVYRCEIPDYEYLLDKGGK